MSKKRHGMNAYDEKLRREMRRQNHIAKDLRTPKYRERFIPNKKKNRNYDDYDDDYSFV